MSKSGGTTMTQPQPGWFPDPNGRHQWRWWDGAIWTNHVANGDVTNVGTPLIQEASDPRSKRRLPVWAWALLGVVAVIAAILLSPLAAVLALVVLVTGIVALAKGNRTWLHLSSRKMALGVTAAAAAVFLVTGSVSAAMLPNAGQAVEAEAAPATAVQPSERPSAKPTRTPTPVATVRDEVVVEPIAFAQVTVQDGAIPNGQTSVATAGRQGQKSLTYRVHLVDGVEVSRELIGEAVTLPPVDEVTTVGTYVAPPPPPPVAAAPQGNGCDPNYADDCVPVASDVDCAGGSGNGPAYFGGIARVVGSDIYELDRDGDGYACEP